KNRKGSQIQSECVVTKQRNRPEVEPIQMKESTSSPRIAQLKLDLGEEKPALVSLEGDDITGNTGILLAGQVERLTGLLRGAATRLSDHRTQSLIMHSQFEQVAQRVYQILAGFAAGSDS